MNIKHQIKKVYNQFSGKKSSHNRQKLIDLYIELSVLSCQRSS